VFNLLLQILDEGHLTDSFGRKVNFTNTLIILTSNIGAKKVVEFGGGVGFNTTSKESQSDQVKKTIIDKSLKQQFSPEFLNRIDDIIVFNPLTDDVLMKIINIELTKLVNRLAEKNYIINFDLNVNEKILSLNKNEGYGARPIKRIIQNLCEDFLSDEILRGKIKEGKLVNIKCNKDGILSIGKKIM
jgi:ATP-dependent Clp protease ATP-binding subunit ClpC